MRHLVNYIFFTALFVTIHYFVLHVQDIPTTFVQIR